MSFKDRLTVAAQVAMLAAVVIGVPAVLCWIAATFPTY